MMREDHQHREAVRFEVNDALSLLTVGEVAALLKVKRSWLYDHVEIGDFPVVRLGRQLRFRRQDLIAYLQDCYRPADAPASAGEPEVLVRRGRPRTGAR